MSGGKILEQIEIDLRNANNGNLKTIYIDVHESSLSRKWLTALNELLEKDYHLEKNYCFFGFVEHRRNGELILEQVNKSIEAINSSSLGYVIDDYFSMENCIDNRLVFHNTVGREISRSIVHDKFNHLHRYFEELQGVSGCISPYYEKANPATRWHIRQLNLLCHEFESWALSYRKELEAPEWMRPSQLMCWLHAPRFVLDESDYELFGIESMNRPLGGVFVGVNKAVGKHHWEVFVDEAAGNPDHIADNLITTTLRPQTEAAGDFDIEWANNPGEHKWQQEKLRDFRQWLINNNIDPEDKSLTIGHPQVAQVDLMRSFGTTNYREIWACLNDHLDVYEVRTSTSAATYKYCWSDNDFMQRQIDIIEKGH